MQVKIKFIITLILTSTVFLRAVSQGLLVGPDVGINITRYQKKSNQQKSVNSYFNPSFQVNVESFGNRTFFGGIVLRGSFRSIEFHRYSPGVSIGVQMLETGMQIKVGFTTSKSTRMYRTYLALGVSYIHDYSIYYKQGNYNYSNSFFTNVTFNPWLPSVEIGNTHTSASPEEKKRSMTFRYYVRYYPLNLFKETLNFEYEPGLFKQFQFNIIEVGVHLGIQHHFHFKRK